MGGGVGMVPCAPLLWSLEEVFLEMPWPTSNIITLSKFQHPFPKTQLNKPLEFLYVSLKYLKKGIMNLYK